MKGFVTKYSLNNATALKDQIATWIDSDIDNSVKLWEARADRTQIAIR